MPGRAGFDTFGWGLVHEYSESQTRIGTATRLVGSEVVMRAARSMGVGIVVVSGFAAGCGAASPSSAKESSMAGGIVVAGGGASGSDASNSGASGGATSGGNVSGNGASGSGATSSGDSSAGARDAGATDTSIATSSDGGGPKCTPNTNRPSGAPALTPGTWVNISPAGVPFDANATAFGQGITLDPCNYGTLYFAVEGADPKVSKSGVYKTTNAGASWTRVGPLDSPINITVDPRNNQHLYASDGVRGNTSGFWVSNDGGQTWAIPSGFTQAAQQVHCDDVYHVEPDPADFNHVLVSFHNFWSQSDGGSNGASGVFESFDGGNTWITHPALAAWALYYGYNVLFLYDPDLHIGNNKTWLFGTQGGGYWRTENAGTTWNKVNDDNMEHGGAQLLYTKSGVVYVTGRPSLLRSTDNGLTWTSLVPVQFGSFLGLVSDGTNLYTGNHGGGQFYTATESNDQTWTPYNAQTFAEGPFQLAFDPVNRIVYSSNIRGGAWALKVP